MTATHPQPKELRNFGLLVGAIVVLVFALIPMLRHHRVPLWPWVIAIPLWLAALLVPAALRYPHRGWTGLGETLGWLNTRIILTVLYGILIVPFGMVMRLIRRDRMARGFDLRLESYRVPSRNRARDQMERPF
jgi:Saxitoxin biosynthesis operon protein SxtJ